MDTTAFITSLATSLLIFLILTFLYIIFSRRSGNAFVYYPALLLQGKTPEELRLRGSFLWFKEAWKVSEQDIVRFAGLDSAVYIHLLDTALKILGYTALFCVPVLVTVSALSNNYEQQKKEQQLKKADDKSNSTYGEFDKFAMGNIPEGSPKIWVFALGAYWLSIVTYLILWKQYRHISRLRSSVLASKINPEEFAALVRDIPKESANADKIDAYFKKIHPHTYEKCILVNNMKHANKLWTKLESTKAKLARCEAVLASSKDSTRPQHKTGALGCFGPKVDSIDFHQQKISELNKSIDEEQKLTRSKKQQAAAVIFFNSTTTAAAAGQCVYGLSSGKWIVCSAPEPRQIIWENLHIHWYQRLIRQAVVYFIVLLTILFYTIPIGFVSALTTLDKLEKLLPFVKHIKDIKPLSTVLQAYLPQLALIVFLALLPKLLLHLSKQEGIVSKSHLERAAAGKFFYFNVFIVFLGVTIATSLFDAIKQIQKDPSSTVTLLGQSIPPAASFFITFIALRFFVGYGLTLSRLVPLIIFHLKKKYLCKTDAELRAAWAPGDFGYATRVPGDMLILTIAMCYAVVAPMVLPFALVYFAFGWMIARHQALKVVVPSYESYGRMWPHINSRIVAALLVSQLAMLGYFLVKKFLGSFVLIPLPIATLIFGLVCNKLYYPSFKVTPLEITISQGMKDIPTVSSIVEAYTPTCLLPQEGKEKFDEDARSAVNSAAVITPSPA